MPAPNLVDTWKVHGLLQQVLDAPSDEAATRALRSLFVEQSDFNPENGAVRLNGDGLPAMAHRIADREGVRVVAVVFPTPGRVLARPIKAALKEVRALLSGDVFLVAANQDRSEWSFIWPTSQGDKEVLRRMTIQRGAPFRTVAENLGKIWNDLSAHHDARRALDRAYDVEAVTKDFFEQYRRVFEKVQSLVSGVSGDDLRLFCQTLFNRLMFISFLQRKGWLTFDGDPDYLEALWRDWEAKGSPDEPSFYDSRLKLLFFAGLNNQRNQDFDQARRILEALIGQVPFLNGGLFEETELDRTAGVSVPNAAIDAILRDLFARFNFTIAESTPLDVQVAVDPEMLGKVFEELVTGRHESGSYYTPRPIVAFMCREALKHYLTTRVPGLSDAAVRGFVDEKDVRDLSIAQGRAVLDALGHVAVVDPACGSGAYLLGMLQELVELQDLVYSSKLVRDAKTLYDQKLQIIERNLYGADVDRFAVNIAMLRLWLSLIIDYAGPGDPPPLPNLDFKIVCGDSLSAPDPNPELESDMFRRLAHKVAGDVAELKAEHIRETGEPKRVLEQQIRQKEAELSTVLVSAAPAGSVDWRVEFAEIFDARGGFDVVVANPPYLRMELFKDKKPILRKNFPRAHSERADLYCYFYARALELLRDGGMLVFISSNKWMRAGYGANLRKLISSEATVAEVIDFGELPVFDSAATFPMIFIARKGSANGAVSFTQVKSLGDPYPDVLALVQRNGVTLPTGALNGDQWLLVGADARSRYARMEAASIPLGEYVRNQIYWGIKTGCNPAFYIDGETREKLIRANPASERIIKPLVVGDDVRKWSILPRRRWLLYMYHGIDAEEIPAVIEHLRPYKDRLEARATKQQWYELQQPQMAYVQAFNSPKIIYPEIASSPRFAFDRSAMFPNNKAFVIPTTDLYLLGVLNSAPAWAYLKSKCSVLGDADRRGRLELRAIYMSKLPIPRASDGDRAAIADLAQRCLDSSKPSKELTDCEREIDERVAALYGVAEIAR